MRTGAIIVAAGMSSRMGEFKPMLELGGSTVIKQVIHTLKQAGADPIVVIVGNHAQELSAHLAEEKVTCLNNKNYDSNEMLDSIKIGMHYLVGKCDAVLFTPADIPLFKTETVESLMKSGAEIAKPVCDGIGGHPLYMKTSLIPSMLTYNGSEGLKGALAPHWDKMIRIQVSDEGILYDADTPEDYQKILDYYEKNEIS